jgi:glycosyltransferase involved in cell wall biosynthesis
MRVLLIVPSISRHGGGVSEIVRLTAEILRQQPGISVEIASNRDDQTDADLPLYAGTPVHIFEAWPPRRFGFSPGLLLHLFRARPEIVHVHALWQFHTAAVLMWSLLTGLPYVVTPHGMLEQWILKRSPRLKALVGWLFHNAFLKRARGFQAGSVKEVDDVRRVAPLAKCRVIPNYVPLPEALPRTPPNWWREDFSDRDIFLFFGRIHEKKGCIELLRAWDEACNRDTSMERFGALVFCGWYDGLADFREVLSEVAARHGNVIFGGAQFGVDRQRTLEAATFAVVPSHSEGLPMVVLECWAAGKPVLMTAACNLPIGFKRGAAIEIETAVPRLVEGLLSAHALDPDQRAAMSSRAIDLVKTEFSAQPIARALTNLYRDA